MMRILITGASGFIGTNLLEYFVNKGNEVFNIDVLKPRNERHIEYWHQVDICNLQALQDVVNEISPIYVVHLAARTDLDEKKDISGYDANTIGVENIAKVCAKDSGVKRVIFASSMLVNEVGYQAKNVFDYNPTTLYGKSKVIGENIVFDNAKKITQFCIIRPTSIWGEWFGEPYKNFFDYVLANKFFHLGDKVCKKTYGYVGNSVFQIDKLLFADVEKIQGKIFYIGDKPEINIAKWANQIALEAKIAKPIKIPFFVFQIAAIFGDVLKVLKINFPMTSFRLKNMTTDNIINLDNIYDVCGNAPYDIIYGIRKTLKWLKKY